MRQKSVYQEKSKQLQKTKQHQRFSMRDVELMVSLGNFSIASTNKQIVLVSQH